MAWGHDYGTVANTNELLGKIRDFLVGRGWTVADDYSLLAVPFIAMRSTGESGDKLLGILIDRIPGAEGLNTCVFRTWKPVAPYWTPNPGTVKSDWISTYYFEGQAGAPSFLEYFSVGDTVWGFNPTTATGRHKVTQGRMVVSAVTVTRLSLRTAAGDVYPDGWYATADPTLILSTGGPMGFARAADTTVDGRYPTIPGSSNPFAYFLFGDKDTLIVVTRIGTNYYGTYVGYVTSYHDPRSTMLLAEVTAGVSTTLQVADPSLFLVDSRYQVITDVTGHTFRVKAIDGNTLTTTAGLEGGKSGVTYPAGTPCGEDLFPVCRTVLRVGDSNSLCTGDATSVFCGDAGAHTTDRQGVVYTRNDAIKYAVGNYFWPDTRRNHYGFLPLYLGKTGDCRGTLRHSFQLNSSVGNSEDVMRLENATGATYKIFNFAGEWYVIKE